MHLFSYNDRKCNFQYLVLLGVFAMTLLFFTTASEATTLRAAKCLSEGWNAFQQDDFHKAEKEWNKARDVLPDYKIQDQRQIVKLIAAMGEWEKFHAEGNIQQQVDVLARMADALKALQAIRETIEVLKKALAISEKSPKQKKYILERMIDLYVFAEHEMQTISLQENASKAEINHKKYNVSELYTELVNILSGMADSYKNTGKFEEDELSLRLHIGNLHFKQEEYAQASSAYARSRELADLMKNDLLELKALINGGQVDIITGDYKNAENKILDKITPIPQFCDASEEGCLLLLSLGILAQKIQQQYNISKITFDNVAGLFLHVAKKTTEPRTKSHAYGYLGELHHRENVKKAIDYIRKAIFFAQNISPQSESFRLLHKLQWRLAGLFRKNNRDKAINAYRQTKRTIERFLDIYCTKKPFQKKVELEKFYYEFIDFFLLAAEGAKQQNKQALLRDVVDVLEIQKQTQLQEFFNDECVIKAKYKGYDEISDSATAIFYPVIFPDHFYSSSNRSLELLLKRPTTGDITWKSITKLDRKEFRKKVEEFRRALEFRSENGEEGKFPDPQKNKKEVVDIGGKLYDSIVRPMEHDFKTYGIKTLVYVPDGILRTIPLIALFDNIEEQFIVEKNYTVITVPGFELTNRKNPFPGKIESTEEKTNKFSPWEKNARILLGGMGTPFKDKKYFCLGSGYHTGKEWLKRHKNNEKCFRTLSAGKALECLREEVPNSKIMPIGDFSIGKLENELESAPYNIMHFHTHGEFKGNKEDTFLLTDDMGKNSDDKLTMERLENLINIGGQSNSPIELFTLSACKTGMGDERAALGLAGIAAKAGAKAVLASLWNAEECYTRYLMKVFYQRLMDSENKSKAEALQTAQRKLLKLEDVVCVDKGNDICVKEKSRNRQNKYDYLLARYWAPFILIGNWK